MTKEQVFEYALTEYGTEPDFPWIDDDSAVLRHLVSHKWYGLVMDVRRDKLGLDGNGTVAVLNVKCDPILIGSFRRQDGFHPAYHMNKDQWLSIRLDGSVSEEDIKALLDLSYQLTTLKRNKKM